MTGPVLFINPNSSRAVTQGIADALAPLGDRFEAVGIDTGPATIASAHDVARAALDVVEAARTRPDCAAFVTACFSDPGLDLLRAALPQPSFGLMESGIMTALARADLFGVVALGPASVARHRVRIRSMGAEGRLAGELALANVPAEATGHDDAVFAATLDLGHKLKARGAGALVLGCAGFAPRRAALERELGIAVIDPVQAAGAMALGAVIG